MPRVCTICTHLQREAIDKAIMAGTDSLRRIATQFGLSEAAVRRHKAAHVPGTLAQAQEAREIAHGDDLLAQLDSLKTDAKRIAGKAEKAESYPAAIAALREQARIIELLLKVTGELQQEGTINLIVAPQWVELRTLILQALAPYPEARIAVAEAVGDR